MPAPYTYTLNHAALDELLQLATRERVHLVTIFRNLASDPFQRGESTSHDPSAREIQIKLFGQWQVYFWSDHAVKEVRIVGFEKAGRQQK